MPTKPMVSITQTDLVGSANFSSSNLYGFVNVDDKNSTIAWITSMGKFLNRFYDRIFHFIGYHDFDFQFDPRVGIDIRDAVTGNL